MFRDRHKTSRCEGCFLPSGLIAFAPEPLGAGTRQQTNFKGKF
jgi:hypothetical protein